MDTDGERRSMESRVSRLEQQVESHEGDIRRFAPIMVEVAENRVRLEQVKHGMDQAILELQKFREQQDEREEDRRAAEAVRDKQARDDKRSTIRWTVGTVLATGMFIIAAISLLLPA